MTYPQLFIELKKRHWLPVKVHNHRVVKVQCLFCKKIIDAKEMEKHSCSKREEWEWI